MGEPVVCGQKGKGGGEAVYFAGVVLWQYHQSGLGPDGGRVEVCVWLIRISIVFAQRAVEL